MLELDHVFCFVAEDGPWLALDQRLDAGMEHAGQGTRNRRLAFTGQYLEVLWMTSLLEAQRNPLRLDRRARWRETGASPIGIGLRGQLPEAMRGDGWDYEVAPGFHLWIHRDNEEHPERPLVFVMEADGDALARMRARIRGHDTVLREVRVTSPGGASPLLASIVGPPVRVQIGSRHELEVIAGDGDPVRLDDALVLIG